MSTEGSPPELVGVDASVVHDVRSALPRKTTATAENLGDSMVSGLVMLEDAVMKYVPLCCKMADESLTISFNLVTDVLKLLQKCGDVTTIPKETVESLVPCCTIMAQQLLEKNYITNMVEILVKIKDVAVDLPSPDLASKCLVRIIEAGLDMSAKLLEEGRTKSAKILLDNLENFADTANTIPIPKQLRLRILEDISYCVRPPKDAKMIEDDEEAGLIGQLKTSAIPPPDMSETTPFIEFASLRVPALKLADPGTDKELELALTILENEAKFLQERTNRLHCQSFEAEIHLAGQKVLPLSELLNRMSVCGKYLTALGEHRAALDMYRLAWTQCLKNDDYSEGHRMLELYVSSLRVIHYPDECVDRKLLEPWPWTAHVESIKTIRQQTMDALKGSQGLPSPTTGTAGAPAKGTKEAAALATSTGLTSQWLSLFQTLMGECQALLGAPPCEYAVISLGSMAQGAMSLFSDLEFAVLIEKIENTTSFENKLSARIDSLNHMVRSAARRQASSDDHAGDAGDAKATDEAIARERKDLLNTQTREVYAYMETLFRLLELKVIALGETTPKPNSSMYTVGFSFDGGGNTPLGKREAVPTPPPRGASVDELQEWARIRLKTMFDTTGVPEEEMQQYLHEKIDQALSDFFVPPDLITTPAKMAAYVQPQETGFKDLVLMSALPDAGLVSSSPKGAVLFQQFRTELAAIHEGKHPVFPGRVHEECAVYLLREALDVKYKAQSFAQAGLSDGFNVKEKLYRMPSLLLIALCRYYSISVPTDVPFSVVTWAQRVEILTERGLLDGAVANIFITTLGFAARLRNTAQDFYGTEVDEVFQSRRQQNTPRFVISLEDNRTLSHLVDTHLDPLRRSAIDFLAKLRARGHGAGATGPAARMSDPGPSPDGSVPRSGGSRRQDSTRAASEPEPFSDTTRFVEGYITKQLAQVSFRSIVMESVQTISRSIQKLTDTITKKKSYYEDVPEVRVAIGEWLNQRKFFPVELPERDFEAVVQLSAQFKDWASAIREKLPRSRQFEPRDYDFIHDSLLALAGEYDRFLSELKRSSNPEFREELLKMPTIIEGALSGNCQLAQNIIGRLFTESGDFRNTVRDGRRAVNNAIKGLHIKQDPEMPGTESAVGMLCHLVMGESRGAPPTELLRVLHNGKQFLLQASLTIPGAPLMRVLETNPHVVGWCPKQYSLLCIMAMLTNPEDAKMDNFVVSEVRQPHMCGHTGCTVEVVGVDNDHAFVDSFIKGGWLTRERVAVKSVLYCFDRMKEPVDAGARDRILALNPQWLLTHWLEAMVRQNEHYYEMFGMPQLEHLYQKREIRIPFYIAPQRVQQMYEKLVHIQDCLSDDPTITLLELLRALDAKLASAYAAELDKPLKPSDRFLSITAGSYQTFKDGSMRTITPSALLSAQQVMGDAPTSIKEFVQKGYTPGQTVKTLVMLSQEQREKLVRDAFKALVAGNPAAYKNLRSVELKERALHKLSFKGLSMEQTDSIIGTLVYLQTPFTLLYLRNAYSLPSSKLEALLRPCAHLSTLDISNSDGIEHLGPLLSHARDLKTLICRDVKTLQTLEKPSLLTRNFLPMLDKLDVRGCNALRSLILKKFPRKLLGFGEVAHMEIGGTVLNPALVVALQSIIAKTVDGVSLRGQAISSTGLGILMRVLSEDTHIQSLNLRQAYLRDGGDKAARIISNMLKQNKALTRLNLEGTGIKDNGAAALADGLKENKTLRILCLGMRAYRYSDTSKDGNSIGDAGTRILAAAAEVHPTLEILDMGRNNMSVAGVRLLAQAAKVGKLLRRLDLAAMSPQLEDKAAETVADALLDPSCVVEELDMQSNFIGDPGACKLAEALVGNRHLVICNLYHNRIGNTGATAIAVALKENSRLTTLNVSNNMLDDEGVRAIADAFRTNPGLAITTLNVHNNFVTSACSQDFRDILRQHRGITMEAFSLDIIERERRSRIVMVVGQAHIWAKAEPPLGWLCAPPDPCAYLDGEEDALYLDEYSSMAAEETATMEPIGAQLPTGPPQFSEGQDDAMAPPG